MDDKKQKNFYRMSFGMLKMSFLILIAVLSFVGIILEILFFLHIIGPGGNITLYAASTACLVVVFLVDMYALVGSSYIFKDKYMWIIFLIPEKVPYENVLQVKYNPNIGEYIIVVKQEWKDTEKYTEYLLNVSPKEFDGFYARLKDNCPALTYEVRTNSKKDKKNKKKCCESNMGTTGTKNSPKKTTPHKLKNTNSNALFWLWTQVFHAKTRVR